MSRSEWSYTPYELAPDRHEVDTAIKYTIPFNWGALHVSEEAQTSYGLVPLTTISEGYVPAERKGKLAITRVFFATPGELEVPSLGPSDLFTNLRVSSEGIDCVVALGDTKEMVTEHIRDSILTQFSSFVGEPTEKVAENIDLGREVPLGEEIAEEAPQWILHMFTNRLYQAIAGPMDSWLRVESDRSYYNAQRKVTRVALVSAFIVAAGSITINPEVAVGGLVLGGGLLGYGMNLKDEMARGYFARTNNREEMLRQVVVANARSVSNDIHLAFCRKHFDQKLAAYDFNVGTEDQ